MPVHRYRQARRAFSVFVTERAELEVVQEYASLLAMRQRVWTACVSDALAECESAFFRDAGVSRPEEYLQGRRFLDLLEDVQILNVRLDGNVDQDLGEEEAEWAMNGIYMWREV